MPIVAPKVKVVRVSQGGTSGPRTSVLFHGIVNLSDAARYGRTRPLIPYANGRLIKSVRFIPPAVFSLGDGPCDIPFLTPNTSNTSEANLNNFQGVTGAGGFSFLGIGGAGEHSAVDTIGIVSDQVGQNFGVTSQVGSHQTSLSGYHDSSSQILDVGPLVITGYYGNTPEQAPDGRTWQPNTVYAFNDSIVDGNGHIRHVIIGGISGAIEPVWLVYQNAIDNTVTWFDDTNLPTGTVHIVVEGYEGIAPMPPYPATIEWVAAPVGGVAGQPMPDITVIIKDQNGDPYLFTDFPIDLAIMGAGTFVSTNTGSPNSARIDTTTGIATFSGLEITNSGTYILRARMIPTIVVEPIFSPPFNVTP